MISPRLLLSTSIKHVPRHGWTKDALAAGAVELGLTPVAHGLVERGGVALVEEHQRRANEQLRNDMDDFMAKPGEKTNKEIVEFGIWSRLQQTTPFQGTWAQAMALGAKPDNAANTVQLLSEVADIIASKFNDREDSYEWYANRAAITAAYCACELYMLSDYSENFQSTKRFVRQRVVNDGSRMMQSMHGVGDVVNTLFSGVGTSAGVALKMGLDVAKSLSPGDGSLLVNPLLDYLQRQGKDEKPATTTDDVHEEDEDNSIIDAKLPEGTSLFGLVSKDVKEAADMVREYNPDFTVITWPMWESIPSDTKRADSRRTVRLIHDKQNIVVDVLRM